MTEERDEPAIPLDQAARELAGAFERLDPERVAGLERLGRVRAAKMAVRGRERERLARRLGAEHPRVRALDTRQAADRALRAELATVLARARIETPRVGEDGWALHGRVVDGQGRGLAGLGVALHDREGHRIEELGHACTDDTGYFRIIYQEGGAAVSKKKEPSYAAGEEVQAPEHAMPEKVASGQGPELFARVFDAAGKLLHVDPRRIVPAPGTVDYIEIVLDGEGPAERPCPPPGGEAKPPRKPRPPAPKPQDPVEWVVRGRVLDASGKPVPGLMVTAVDKDNRYDDLLGATLTNREGAFRIVYDHRAFRESGEIGPDLFVTATDADGVLRYSSRDRIRFDAGPDENFDIVLR